MINAPILSLSSATFEPDDSRLLPYVIDATIAAGSRLWALFSPLARPCDREEMLAAARRNEDAALPGLRQALEGLRPGIGWVDGEQETAPLPSGEWWVVDAVEGNVNHVHGMPNWGVSVALMRDGIAVLAVFHQPIGDLTWTALRGAGAWVNGRRLRASNKSGLEVAIVATGQAEPGKEEVHRRIARSVDCMLQHALLVRVTVPSTFPILLVAAGQNDVFWQVQPVLPGVAAGVLLVEEAGGIVTRMDGSAWQPGCDDILVAAPGVHASAVDVLRAAMNREAV